MKLERALAAWGSEPTPKKPLRYFLPSRGQETLGAARRVSDAFVATLKAELEALSPEALGLQQAANWPVQLDAPVTVSVMAVAAGDDAGDAALQARVGVFFTETIAGCNCAMRRWSARLMPNWPLPLIAIRQR